MANKDDDGDYDDVESLPEYDSDEDNVIPSFRSDNIASFPRMKNSFIL